MLLLQRKVGAKKQRRPETCFKQVNPPFTRRGIIPLVWSFLRLFPGKQISAAVLRKLDLHLIMSRQHFCGESNELASPPGKQTVSHTCHSVQRQSVIRTLITSGNDSQQFPERQVLCYLC